MRVTVFRKANCWKPEHLTAEDSLKLASVGFQQTIPSVYEDVPTTPSAPVAG